MEYEKLKDGMEKSHRDRLGCMKAWTAFVGNLDPPSPKWEWWPKLSFNDSGRTEARVTWLGHELFVRFWFDQNAPATSHQGRIEYGRVSHDGARETLIPMLRIPFNEQGRLPNSGMSIMNLQASQHIHLLAIDEIARRLPASQVEDWVPDKAIMATYPRG